MRCRFPRNVGYEADGKTITFHKKRYSPEYIGFQVPCGKCLQCRLEYARNWAIRGVHESIMNKQNCFITLTYSDEHLGDGKLNYEDFQTFMKDLRRALDYSNIKHQIGFMAVGEYGKITKRKHWHACLFGFEPKDSQYLYTTKTKDKIFGSELLTTIWGKGIVEYGSVTFKSAGYVARYSAKKLVHGKDDQHLYKPIFRTSKKNAIGKRFLEKYWKDIFSYGNIILEDGKQCGIPRYYEKWLKDKRPKQWITYVTDVKIPMITKLMDKNNVGPVKHWTKTKQEKNNTLLEQKFKILQNNLKL